MVSPAARAQQLSRLFSPEKYMPSCLTPKRLTAAAALVALTLSVAQASVSLSVVSDLANIQGESFTASGWGGVYDLYKLSGTSTGFVGADNTIKADEGLFGGLFDLYQTNATIADAVISGNTMLSTALAGSASDADTKASNALGGAVMVKNGHNTFRDTIFTNNVIKATGETLAAGGAIYQDAVKNETDGTLASALAFEVTKGKNLTYSGNNVVSSDPNTYYGLYGTVSTAAGGFLFLDRDSSAEFNIAENASLTIGTTGATGNMDSIASSIAVDGKANTAEIVKTGAGTLTINSSLEKFYGSTQVNEGTLAVSKTWKVMNDVIVGGAGKDAVLAADNIILTTSPTSLTWNGRDYKKGDGSLVVTTGSLTVKANGLLQTKIGSVFEDGAGKGDASLTSTSVALKDGFTFEAGSALSLTDSGTYTAGLYNSVLLKSGADTVAFLNATLDKGKSDSDTVSISADTALRSITGFTTVNVEAGKTLAVAGQDSASDIVNLVLAESAGDDTEFTLTNNASVAIENLSGAGFISVGEAGGKGAKLTVDTLAMTGGTIFVDPAVGHSVLTVDSVANGKLNVDILAGSGALVTLGDSETSALASVNKLGFTDCSSVLYVGETLDITNGSLSASDTLTAAATTTSRTVTIGSGAALIVDQSGINGQMFTADGNSVLTFTDDGKLGIVNASAGTVKLADTVEGLTQSALSTDTPFIEATLNDDGTITNTLSVDNGLVALASTGVQAMMRRSDLVLAKSVADRTMIAGERRSGNMWVDVTGEHYKVDALENGGSFKSDIGYGTFGFDMPFSRDSFLGAAYQYNKGKLKSSHSDIKNKIDGNGFSLYAGTNFGDFQLVADAAYLKNTNDITASQTALTQELDAKIYSLGLRGQYRLTLGTFEIIPSIGARVSRLETEAMRVGSIVIDKQKQNLYQFPMALQLAGFTTKLGTWFVAPKLMVSYVPTLGDKEISILGLNQTVIDTQPLQGSFGLRAVKGRTMWNIDLTAGTGNDGVETYGGRISMKFRW